MAEWERVRLTEVLDFKEGPGILAKDFHEQGVPLIRLAGVKRGAHILDGCNYLDPRNVAARWNHFTLEVGDVLLSTSASLGEVAVVTHDGVGAVPYTGLIRFRPKVDRVSRRFIPIALTSRPFKLQIEAMGVGSVMKHFGPMHLRQMTLELPPHDVQEAISDVVEAIDDKIEANRKLAATADELAHAHYQRVLRAADRKVRLGELLTLEYGKALPATKRRDGEVPVFGSGGVVGTHDEALAHGPGIIVGRKGSVGTVYWSEAPYFPIDTVYYVNPNDGIPQSFLYYAIRSQRFGERSTDSAVPGLNRNDAYRSTASLPTETELIRFDVRASSLFKLDFELAEQNAKLVELRDTLLPKLMSGQLRVCDAEQLVADAV